MQGRSGRAAALVLARRIRADNGLRLVLDGEDAIADGQTFQPSSINPRELSLQTVS